MPEKLTDTQVLYNSEELDPPEDKRQIGEILEWVEQEVSPREEVLTRAELNGREVSLDESTATAEQPLDEGDKLECFGQPTREIAREAFEYADELLPAVAEDLDECARLLRGADQQKGMDTLSDCVWVLDWFLQITARTGDIYQQEDPRVYYADFPENEQPFELFRDLDGVIELLREIQQTQESEDWVLLADLVDYELQPMVEDWAEEVPKLRSRLGAETARS